MWLHESYSKYDFPWAEWVSCANGVGENEELSECFSYTDDSKESWERNCSGS